MLPATEKDTRKLDTGKQKNDPGMAIEPDSESRIARELARNAWRHRLLESRRQLIEPQRAAANEALLARLCSHVGDVARELIAIYWPIRNEPQLEPLAGQWAGQGAGLALPVVDAEAQPLRFVRWRHGDPLMPGAYGIARPVQDETVRPTLIVIPCLGFDLRAYRLGYGGGYYDRTIAALQADPSRPIRTVGVAWDEALIDDFVPLPTDLPLDAVITPSAVVAPRPMGAS
jgi:5-formyltetrahydrofolate cyclo-ligase